MKVNKRENCCIIDFEAPMVTAKEWPYGKEPRETNLLTHFGCIAELKPHLFDTKTHL